MDLMEAIKERRSIRRYEEKSVPEELINKVLEAIRWTPSWANTQCWEVVVVKDIVEAPVLLALCGKLESSGYYKGEAPTKFGDWLMFDLGLVTQSICLAAFSLGLGTLITGLFDHDKAKEIIKVPEGYELVTIIPMGYPAKKPSCAPKRKEISEFVHDDTF